MSSDNVTVQAAEPGVQPEHARLHHLFRASQSSGRVHPLLRVMQLHGSPQPSGAAKPVPPPVAAGAPAVKLLPAEVRRRVAELPPLPQAAQRALRTLQREDAALDDVAADIACDASLTARVLRLANSPFYGVSRRVSSTRDAAQILGRRTLESILTLACVCGQFGSQRSRQFDVGAFWRHALGSAIVARGLARGIGLDEDQAFVAGLLHDIGLLAMSEYFPAELDSLLGNARTADSELCSIERELGLTEHAGIGSWIAAHWHFPEPVVRAIAAHHAPSGLPPGIDADMAACVHVANAITHALDVANLSYELVPQVDPVAWKRVALTDDGFRRLFEEAQTGVQALCAALAL